MLAEYLLINKKNASSAESKLMPFHPINGAGNTSCLPPINIQASISQGQFKARLKTHLYKQAYDIL